MYSLVSYEEDCVCLSLELPGVLVETECYGTEVIKTMISMQFPLFQGLHSHLLCWKQSSPNIMRRTELEALQVNSQSEELTGEEWNTTKEHADTIQAALQVYLKEKASLSQSFDYWNTYVSNVFPIFRNLTNSLCTGDWILYLNAIERATSLLFLFGRTNNCQWISYSCNTTINWRKSCHSSMTPTYMNGGFVLNR